MKNFIFSHLTKIQPFLSFRFRFIPTIVFTTSVLLTLKISCFVQKLSTHDWIGVSSVKASTTDTTQKDKENTSKQVPQAQAQAQPNTFTTLDPSTTNLEHYKMSESLKERREKIQQREAQLPQKEATLRTIEKKIDEKTKALQDAQTKLEKLVKSVDEKENVNLDRLVKMAETMKATEASPILESVDFVILIEIMEKIKPKKAAEILAVMDPKKAAYLITQLALRKKVVKQ